LTYQVPGFATEMRNTKHILKIKHRLKIFILLKWNKTQKCERPNETRSNKL